MSETGASDEFERYFWPKVDRARTPWCVCGHAMSSHRPDPNDVWVTERCKTCGCAAFANRDEAKMQGADE